MKADKIKTEACELNVDGISLLSIEEYEACKEHIPLLDHEWWLCSPGVRHDGTISDRLVMTVSWNDGYVDTRGTWMNLYPYAVRPVLKIPNLESSGLVIGDKFMLFGYVWTVITNKSALCDHSIGNSYYRKVKRCGKRDHLEEYNAVKFIDQWLAKKIKGGSK